MPGTELFTFAADADDDPVFGCTIPEDGPNAPRVTTIAGGLPVVLRDPIDNEDHFEAFSCDVRSDNPDTPDRVDADVLFVREVHGGARVRMHDGERVDFWGFSDPLNGNDKLFPSPLIRVREGQVVHVRLEPSKNTHTIHFHGIEPTAHNDGVGHTSFEVKDHYTYQWRPASSGTYFYHCHKNTVLHFELGMYGPLVVDPPDGPGFARRGLEVVPYDREVLWAPDDVDPGWHDLNHSAGLRCGRFDDRHSLHRFRPRYFLLTGVPQHRTRSDRSVAVRGQRGELLLIRLLNASYSRIRVRLPFDAECIGVDGHALGGPKDHRYSSPYAIAAGEPVELTTAQRWDLLVRLERTGRFTVPFEFLHWIDGRVHGTVETEIRVD